ncbi:MAG: hypothetical protein ACI4U3_00400 [Traorella sp.]
MVISQGENIHQIEDLSLLPTADYQISMISKTRGIVQSIKTLELAKLSMILGAERQSKDDKIDLSVGLSLNKKVGDEVNVGDVLAVVHTNAPLTEDWIDLFYQCYQIGDEIVTIEPLIYKKLLTE